MNNDKNNFRRYWLTDVKEMRQRFPAASMSDSHLAVLRAAEAQKRLLQATILCTLAGNVLEHLSLYEGPVWKMGNV